MASKVPDDKSSPIDVPTYFEDGIDPTKSQYYEILFPNGEIKHFHQNVYSLKCKGCGRSFKSNSILKHIFGTRLTTTCMDKHSEEDITCLRLKAKNMSAYKKSLHTDKYKEKNRDKVRLYNAAYYDKNKDRIKKMMANHYKENMAAYAEKNRQYREEEKQLKDEEDREWFNDFKYRIEHEHWISNRLSKQYLHSMLHKVAVVLHSDEGFTYKEAYGKLKHLRKKIDDLYNKHEFAINEATMKAKAIQFEKCNRARDFGTSCPRDCPKIVCENDVREAYKDLKFVKKLGLFEVWMNLQRELRFGIQDIIGYDILLITKNQCSPTMNCYLYKNYRSYEATGVFTYEEKFVYFL